MKKENKILNKNYSEVQLEENFFSAFAKMEELLNIQEISIDQIRTNPDQPRKVFNEDKLTELAQSIKEHGVFSPIIVTLNDASGYDLVAGERRLRASKLAGLENIPAIIRELNQPQRQEISLLENIQREQLTPIEEATAYNVLIDNYGYTQEEFAKKIGKSRSHVANILRLNNLNNKVKILVNENKLTMSQARTILSKNIKDQYDFALHIIDNKLTTRQVEEKVLKNSKVKKPKNHELEILEDQIKKITGLKVQVKGNFNKGKIILDYDKEGLINFITKLGVEL